MSDDCDARAVAPVSVQTRGQPVWGDAVCLHGADGLAVERQARLAAVAAALGFHDYALEVLDGMLAANGLEDGNRTALRGKRTRYWHDLQCAPPAPAARQYPHWID